MVKTVEVRKLYFIWNYIKTGFIYWYFGIVGSHTERNDFDQTGTFAQNSISRVNSCPNYTAKISKG